MNMQTANTPHIQAATAPHIVSRKTLLAARTLTIIMAVIWVFFGIGWLTRSKDVIDAMHHLGYPLYMTYAIGATHVLGGVGLLIPNRPRLTQWVLAGLTYDLVLAAISHLASHDVITNALHPIVLIVFLVVLMVLRDRTGADLWSSR